MPRKVSAPSSLGRVVQHVRDGVRARPGDADGGFRLQIRRMPDVGLYRDAVGPIRSLRKHAEQDLFLARRCITNH